MSDDRNRKITDEVVERAWAAIVGKDIARQCYEASIIRADLRDALEAAFPDLPEPPSEG